MVDARLCLILVIELYIPPPGHMQETRDGLCDLLRPMEHQLHILVAALSTVTWILH